MGVAAKPSGGFGIFFPRYRANTRFNTALCARRVRRKNARHDGYAGDTIVSTVKFACLANAVKRAGVTTAGAIASAIALG